MEIKYEKHNISSYIVTILFSWEFVYEEAFLENC